MNIAYSFARVPFLAFLLLTVASCQDFGSKGSKVDGAVDGGTDTNANGGRSGSGTGGTVTGSGGGAVPTGGAIGTGGAGGSGGTGEGGGSGGSSTTDGGIVEDASTGADRPMTCSSSQKLCGGACVPVTDPAYGCGATTCDASTCPSPGAGGTVVCQSGACVIGTCPTNFKKCGNRCVAVTDPAYGCGATTCDATTCPPAGTGTLTCQAGACVIGSCGAGTKKCGDKCVTTDANNGCADPARCTACANNEACMGSPSTCQCVPIPMATACNGKCGSVPNGCGGTHACSSTCPAMQTCGGGGTPNVCGCTPSQTMAVACNGKCGSITNSCGGTYACSSTCPAMQTCGGGGTPNVCGCTPSQTMAVACNGKCGSITNSCGGTYACSSTCPSPQTCGGAGTANVCGCPRPSWTFEGSTQGWTATGTSVGVGTIASQGSGSLQILLNITASSVSARVPFCQTQNLVGKSFRGKVRLETPSASTSIYVHVLIRAGGVEGGCLGQTPLTPGEWTTLDFTFEDGCFNQPELLGAATHIGLNVLGGEGHMGSVYLDDVHVQ